MNRYSLGKYISLNDLENEFGFKEKVTGKRFLLNERKPVLLGWSYGSYQNRHTVDQEASGGKELSSLEVFMVGWIPIMWEI